MTHVDREGGRMPSLMKQHAEETGLDFDEAAMYEHLIELARGKSIGKLVIDGELKYIVNLMYEWWGSYYSMLA